MTDKEKADVYLALYQRQMQRFNETQQLASRLTLATWTVLVAGIYTALEKNLNLGQGACLVVAIPVLYVVWAISVRDTLHFDKELFVKYRAEVESIVTNATVTAVAESKKSFYVALEGSVTFLLTLLLLYVLR
jgi:hypothetical protein